MESKGCRKKSGAAYRSLKKQRTDENLKLSAFMDEYLKRSFHPMSTDDKATAPSIEQIEISGSGTEQYETYDRLDSTLLRSCGLLDEIASGDDLTEGISMPPSIGGDSNEEMLSVASGSTGEFQMHANGIDSNEHEAAIGSGTRDDCQMQAIGSDSNELQAIGSGSRDDCQMQVIGSDSNELQAIGSGSSDDCQMQAIESDSCKEILAIESDSCKEILAIESDSIRVSPMQDIESDSREAEMKATGSSMIEASTSTSVGIIDLFDTSAAESIDPAKLVCQKVSPEVKKKIISFGPCQPKTTKKVLCGDRYRSCSQQVFSHPDGTKRNWISYSGSRNALFCIPCLLFSDSSLRGENQRVKQGSAFTKEGYSSWKKQYEGVLKHERSNAHCNAVLAQALFLHHQTIVDSLSDQAKADASRNKLEVARNRSVMQRIVDVVMFLGRQGLSLRGHRETICDDSISTQEILLKY